MFQDQIAKENLYKRLIRTTDIQGREIHPETKGQIVIFYYSDGSIEKKLRLK